MSNTRTPLFDPALASGKAITTRAGVKSRLTTPVKYYTFPTRPTSSDVLNVLLMCALAATSASSSLSQWKSWIATYTNVMFEGLVTSLPSDQYESVPITEAMLGTLREKFDAAQLAEDGAMDSVVHPHSEEFASSFHFDGSFLPTPPAPLDIGFFSYNRDMKALMSHYSLCVFLAGKQIDDANRSAITVARPKAVIDKFKIENVDLLNGPLRISNSAHLHINQAWLEMTTLKATCFREFATYTHRDTDLQQDIILTTVNMMRHMQMQHAAFIYKFLLAYPWARDFPPLRKFVLLFEKDLIAASSIDEHLQPFIKVIYGDKSGMFQRKELGPLIACALATEQELSDSLSQYYHDDKYGSIVEAFTDERKRHEVQNPSEPLVSPQVDPSVENEEQL